jgi:hypothetical protein
MKQPRTSDFDPNAKDHSLKSSMEDFPAIEHPPRVLQAPVSDPGLSDRPGRDEPPVPTGRRKIKPRHAFDIYEDQAEALQKLSLEDRMRGGAGSQSAMVREAIDDYIAKHRAE